MTSKLRSAGQSRALAFRAAGLGVAACLATIVFAGPAAAQSIAVVVNGQPILSSEVSARAALSKLGGGKPEKSTIDELIDEKLKLAEVKRYNMVAGDAQVDQAYASIAARTKLSTEQFTKAIGQRGVTAQTLKDRLKADLAGRLAALADGVAARFGGCEAVPPGDPSADTFRTQIRALLDQARYVRRLADDLDAD